MEATEHVVSVRHGVIVVKGESGGTSEAVGVACDDDAVLRLGDEVEGLVGVMAQMFHRYRYL